MVRFAWSVDPEMAVGLSLRFSVPGIERELEYVCDHHGHSLHSDAALELMSLHSRW